MALNDEQLTTLAAELSLDPLSRNYAAMSDEAAASDLNTEYRNYSQSITVEFFEKAMRESRKWDQYAKRSDDRATFPARRAVFGLDRIYFRGFRVKSVRVLSESPWNELSDHLPVEAELSIS